VASVTIEFGPCVIGVRADGIVDAGAWQGGSEAWESNRQAVSTVSKIARHHYRDVTLVIAGHCLLDAAEQYARLAAAVEGGKADEVTGWPGSHSTIVIQGDSVTARADLAGQFPLYYARRGEEILIGTDPRPLAAAHGREPDPLTAAAYIACPAVLPLWTRRSAFTGVARLEGGEILRAGRGSLRVERGLSPLPAPGRTLAVGADLLREALTAAVGARCADGAVSSDFSGGLDSTSE